MWTGYLCCSVIGLSTLLPSAPGYVGVIQSAFVLCFAHLGLDESTGFAASVIIHSTQYVSVTAIGLVILARSGWGWNAMKKLWNSKEAS
jgi:uncharacterized membrane protein YbhN (UPF0104 family)